MKKFKLVFMFFLVTFISLAQSETSRILTDSTSIIGEIINDSNLMESIYQYRNTFDKEIKRGTKVLVTDIQKWKKLNSNEFQEYFEILYNNKTYYLESDKIIIDENYYSQLLTMDYFVKLNFKENTKTTAKIIFDDELLKAITFIEKCEAKGLVILDWSFYDESEYIDGTSVKISVYNPTKKKVKYLWFTFIGYNAVDDVIIDRLKMTSKITMKGIGPINPEESGTYEYDYVWHSDLVQKVKIFQIKVQYMDGTFKTILNPNEVIIDKQLYEVLKEPEKDQNENIEIKIKQEINEEFILGKWSDENSVLIFFKSGDFIKKLNDGSEIKTKWKLVNDKIFVGIDSYSITYNILSNDINYFSYITSENTTIFNAYRIGN